VLLLAFDTATPHVTVALHDGTRTLATYDGEGSMRHGELLAPGITHVLARAGADVGEVTDLVVGVGPGPYTGLRVGVVTGRTLAAALGVRASGVCSLDGLAASAREDGVDLPFVAASDARRKEVYWARYDSAGRRVRGPYVDLPAALADQLVGGEQVVGRGARLYADVLPAADGPLDPRAASMAAAVADGLVETLPLEPLYLRRPDAAEPAERTRAT
jgi:tRNA threonylcarbamoyl adenosine modification protein YeaZ